MEGMSGKEGCIYEGQIYVHGSELCVFRRCIICMAGRWHDKKLYGVYVPVP
jgi:hypothetical protein